MNYTHGYYFFWLGRLPLAVCVLKHLLCCSPSQEVGTFTRKRKQAEATLVGRGRGEGQQEVSS